MNLKILLVTACGLVPAAPALAAGGADPPSWSPSAAAEDPAIKSARAAFTAGDYPAAQATLKAALATSPDNADLNNLYAYALRKGPNPDMASVFKYYGEALRIDPKHRNAHEYIGEAYLMVDDPAKAREHLAALDKLCLFGCEQYSELKKAIAAYDQKVAKK